MSKVEELLPCPFCLYSDPWIQIDENEEWSRSDREFHAYCDDCSITVSGMWESDTEATIEYNIRAENTNSQEIKKE